MISSIFSHLFKVFTFLTVIAAPLAAQAGDPRTVEDFNNHIFKLGTKAVRSTLDLAGENNAMPCDDLMVVAVNSVYLCLRDKLKCQETTGPSGIPVVFCAVGVDDDCDRQAFFAAEDFWANPNNRTCKEMKVDVTKPGCGNLIREFGEDCDLGETNGTPNAACSEKCKGVAASAEGAGTAPIVAAPAPAQAPAENNVGGGSCALHSVGNKDFSLGHLLVLGAGAILLLLKTLRNGHAKKVA